MGSSYTSWSNLITTRMNQAAPVTESIWGNYNQQTGTGTVYAKFQNDSNATIDANVLFVVTEDNIAVTVANGDNMHNHVVRSYIPDYIGTPVTVRNGYPVTVSYPFTILPNWNLHNVEIVAMIQNPIAVGSTKEVLQAAIKKVEDMTGIEESHNDMPITASKVNVFPNPGINGTRFAFTLPMGTEYKINIFDVTGRTIKTLKGIGSGKQELVKCELNKAGVYLYRFESNLSNSSGKIIVK